MSVEDRSAIASTGVIRGWGCTPTGDPPAAAVTNDSHPNNTCLPATLVRGWRRTCLYTIILFLMVLVFLNIALTLWIIGTLQLNAHGIGPIKIVPNGIQLAGDAWIPDRLVASSIASQPSQPVTIHSHRNFTVLVSEPANHNNTSKRVELAKLLIKRDSVVCSGRKFEVRDSHGKSVFAASRDEVRMSADTLAVDGEGGVTVRNAIQTPSVRAPPGSDLQLESLTRRLSLRAPQSIHFESRAGSIDVTSHGDINFDSVVGAIKIDAPNIVIKNLTEASVTDKPQKNIRTMRVYQLCACATGKLFLAAADGACAATDDELCR